MAARVEGGRSAGSDDTGNRCCASPRCSYSRIAALSSAIAVVRREGPVRSAATTRKATVAEVAPEPLVRPARDLGLALVRLSWNGELPGGAPDPGVAFLEMSRISRQTGTHHR